MKFEDKVFDFIYERKLISSDDKVLLGVSGGADSVCLFRVLISLLKRFHLCRDISVVHINHMIRGAEADGDQRFVEALCEGFGVKCHSYSRDIPALSKQLGLSEEETGRKVRYEVFAELAESLECTKIAVAHHKNDLAETVIFNMVRGSGLSGLTGISSVRENIVRPLLCVTRQEIEDYLADLGQDFRTDSTNATMDYTRNKIRHAIIPVLEELNGEAVEHIAALAMDAEKADAFLEEQAVETFDMANTKACMDLFFYGSPDGMNIGKCVCGTENDTKKFESFMNRQSEDGCVYLDISTLREADVVVRDKVIHNCLIKVAGKKKDITRRHIDAVASLMYTDTGKRVVLPYGMVARRSYDRLVIERSRKPQQESGLSAPNERIGDAACQDGETIIGLSDLSNGNVTVALASNIQEQGAGYPRLEFMLTEQSDNDKIFMEKNVYTKIFSYDKILAKNAQRLCIRTKREGDYIVIAPDGRTKKLNRIFIDAKTDRTDRESWPLLALDDEILWVVGLRYNEAYRVTEDTKRILKVTYIKSV